MSMLNYIQWDHLILGGVCLISLTLVLVLFGKSSQLKRVNRNLRKRVHDLEDDVKTLYSTAATIGEKIKIMEKDNRILKEQQEQLSLKEPSQQSYKNAIQQIRNGDSIGKIVESSGLSMGEIELLRLLNEKQTADTTLDS